MVGESSAKGTVVCDEVNVLDGLDAAHVAERQFWVVVSAGREVCLWLVDPERAHDVHRLRSTSDIVIEPAVSRCGAGWAVAVSGLDEEAFVVAFGSADGAAATFTVPCSREPQVGGVIEGRDGRVWVIWFEEGDWDVGHPYVPPALWVGLVDRMRGLVWRRHERIPAMETYLNAGFYGSYLVNGYLVSDQVYSKRRPYTVSMVYHSHFKRRFDTFGRPPRRLRLGDRFLLGWWSEGWFKDVRGVVKLTVAGYVKCRYDPRKSS